MVFLARSSRVRAAGAAQQGTVLALANTNTSGSCPWAAIARLGAPLLPAQGG